MEVCMTEFQTWTLFSSFMTQGAIQFLGLIVAVWLGFRMSSNIFESGNAPVIAKVLASLYCICIAFFLMFSSLQQLMVVNDFAAGFAELAKTTDISAAAVRLSEIDTTLPSIINIVLVLSIILFQLAGIWMKKAEN